MPTIKKIILVLGHRNDAQGVISSIARERLDQGIKEYKQYPSSKLMVTGAFGLHFNTTSRPHAFYLEKYLRQHGIPAGDILPFVPSHNTVEDAQLSHAIVPQYGCKEIIVVTSDFHLPRVRYLFEPLFAGYILRFVESATLISVEERRLLLEHEQKALRQLKAGNVR